MPQLHLIVRFTTNTDEKATCNINDVSLKGISRALHEDASRRLAMCEVENEECQNGQPARYLIAVDAVDVDHHESNETKICYGTMSHEDARLRFERLPEQIKESDKERIRGDGNDREKAVIRVEGNTGIRVKMRTNSFLWYELVTVDTYAYEEWIAEEEENQKAKELWKLNLEQAIGEDVDMLDDLDEEMESP